MMLIDRGLADEVFMFFRKKWDMLHTDTLAAAYASSFKQVSCSLHVNDKPHDRCNIIGDHGNEAVVSKHLFLLFYYMT